MQSCLFCHDAVDDATDLLLIPGTEMRAEIHILFTYYSDNNNTIYNVIAKLACQRKGNILNDVNVRNPSVLNLQKSNLVSERSRI